MNRESRHFAIYQEISNIKKSGCDYYSVIASESFFSYRGMTHSNLKEGSKILKKILINLEVNND